MAQKLQPGFVILLTQGSQPTIEFEFDDRGGGVVDLTGPLKIKLAVKRSVFDPDSGKLFDLTGVVTNATKGLFTISFDGSATGLAGAFSAELRRWGAADPTNMTPRDAYSGSVIISSATIQKET